LQRAIIDHSQQTVTQ